MAMLAVLFTLIVSFPAFKGIDVGKWKMRDLIFPLFSICIAGISIFGLFRGINDSLIVALCFVFMMTIKSESRIVEYINNTSIFLLVLGCLMLKIDIIWISFALISLIIFNQNRNSSLLPLIAIIFAVMPGFKPIGVLYDQWGGLLILPAMLGIIGSKQSRDKLTSSVLLILLISSTQYMSLGYAGVILLGMALILIFVEDYHNKKPFLYTMGLVPFVGIGDPYNIVGLYISITVVVFYKSQLLNIIDGLETEGGSIKNIRYQDILLLLLGTYILAGGPGSPVFWLITSASKQNYLLYFLILLDIVEFNGVGINNATSMGGKKVDLKNVNEINSFIYIVLIAVIYRAIVFSFSYIGLVLLAAFLPVILLYKRKKRWLQLILEVKKVFSVTYRKKAPDSNIHARAKVITETKSPIKITLSGIDEGIIWSIFIFIVSFLLIWRYL